MQGSMTWLSGHQSLTRMPRVEQSLFIIETVDLSTFPSTVCEAILLSIFFRRTSGVEGLWSCMFSSTISMTSSTITAPQTFRSFQLCRPKIIRKTLPLGRSLKAHVYPIIITWSDWKWRRRRRRRFGSVFESSFTVVVVPDRSALKHKHWWEKGV